MKALGRFLIWIVVICAILVLTKNIIAKAAIEKGVRIVTGLPLSIKNFEFSLMSGYVRIDGFELHNPDGYPEKVMMSMPKLYLDIEPSSILKGKTHIEDLQIHLQEFNVVKNEQGQLNLDSLKALTETKKESAANQTGAPKPESTKKAPEVQIDQVILQIDKVSYKDFSKSKPLEQNFNIQLNERYRDITNLNALVSLIVVKAMMSTSIASLTNFDLGGLQGSVTNVMSSSAQLATEAAEKAQGLIKDNAAKVMEKVDVKEAAQALEGTAKNLTGTLTGAAGNLKDKMPSFGLGSSKEQSKS